MIEQRLEIGNSVKINIAVIICSVSQMTCNLVCIKCFFPFLTNFIGLILSPQVFILMPISTVTLCVTACLPLFE